MPFFDTCLVTTVFGALGVEQSQRRVTWVSSPVPSRGCGHSSIPNLMHDHGHSRAPPSWSPHPVPTAWPLCFSHLGGGACPTATQSANCRDQLWQKGDDSERTWTSRTCLRFGVHPTKTRGCLFLHLRLAPHRWTVFVVWSKFSWRMKVSGP